ncbi:MAG: hypothetical protein ABSH34_37575, partial [Verrucomicrobiota bacterium]
MRTTITPNDATHLYGLHAVQLDDLTLSKWHIVTTYHAPVTTWLAVKLDVNRLGSVTLRAVSKRALHRPQDLNSRPRQKVFQVTRPNHREPIAGHPAPNGIRSVNWPMVFKTRKTVIKTPSARVGNLGPLNRQLHTLTARNPSRLSPQFLTRLKAWQLHPLKTRALPPPRNKRETPRHAPQEQMKMRSNLPNMPPGLAPLEL